MPISLSPLYRYVRYLRWTSEDDIGHWHYLPSLYSRFSPKMRLIITRSLQHTLIYMVHSRRRIAMTRADDASPLLECRQLPGDIGFICHAYYFTRSTMPLSGRALH